MKHPFLFPILLLMAAACGKTGTDEPEVPAPADYVGTVTVEYGGSTFDNEDISVSLAPSEDGSTASLTIHQIKFVPQMPVTLDVTIPGITLQAAGGKTPLSCGDVTPLALGGEMPRYQVTGFSGTLEGRTLSFSLHFGDYPTRFVGEKAGSF